MPPAAPPLLELDDASVVLGSSHRVLDHLNLTVAVGEHTALLGPNGSGKSSLIKLLTRELWPLRHADERPPVRLFGQARWNVFDLRRQLGILSPELDHRFVESGVLGLEAVISGFFASQGLWHHRVTAAMEASARAALERLGVAHLAEQPLDAMSCGEARRILIARALVHEPVALLLDEPTTGLDLVARRQFLETLRQLAHDGTTILMVTHHVEEIIPEIEHLAPLVNMI